MTDGAASIGLTATPSCEPTCDDDTLMQRYVRGDAAAFEALYSRHKNAVFSYLRRQVDTAVAADCHQEVWTRVIVNRQRYKPAGKFSAYVFRIAHNVLMDHFRQTRSAMQVAERLASEAPATSPSPATALENSNAAQRLNGLLRGLPPAQRDAVVMKKESGLSLKEIAEITGATEEAVKSRVRYAMNYLRNQLAGHVDA